MHSIDAFLQPSVDSSILKVTDRSLLPVRRAAPHLWSRHPPTLHVPFQFDPSLSPSRSSSPSSCSDPGRLVNLSGGVFHSCLKTFLISKSFPQLAIYPFLRLISWNYDHSLFGSHWRCSIGKCGSLSQPSWLWWWWNCLFYRALKN